jgi:hypothetical protein
MSWSTANILDLRGRKVDPKIGDKMEFVEVYEASLKTDDALDIDIDYYMDSSIYGLFARFLSYMTQFEPANADSIDWDDKVAYTDYDEHVIKTAKKYIEEFCSGLVARVITSDPRAKQYRDAYQEVTINSQTVLYRRHEHLAFMIRGFDLYDDKSQASNRTGQFSMKGTRPLDRIRAQIEAYAASNPKYGDMVINTMSKRGVSLTDAQMAYMSTKSMSMSKIIGDRCDAAVKDCEAGFTSRIDGYVDLLSRYEIGLSRIVNMRRTGIDDVQEDEMVHELNSFTESELSMLDTLFRLTMKWITHLRMRKQAQSVCIAITRRLGDISKVAGK